MNLYFEWMKLENILKIILKYKTIKKIVSKNKMDGRHFQFGISRNQKKKRKKNNNYNWRKI